MPNEKAIDEQKQYFQKKNFPLFIRQDIFNKVEEVLRDNFSITLQLVVEPKNDDSNQDKKIREVAKILATKTDTRGHTPIVEAGKS